ncbi:MAG: FMN-binding negative transcriptional regulator [Acetobacteraceae bacterium]|nr:FMN-binding negative transcriptional regulator [Acetobacteraceae bacterium]
MYIPAHFNEDRVGVLHDLIRTAGLATLVSMTADGLIASHAPLMLDPDPAPYGTLIGHLAKANPHVRSADAGVQTLVIFQGPEGYITPSYYAAKREHGKVVPTWNYAVVHVRGRGRVFEDRGELIEHVTELTASLESAFEKPWGVGDAPAGYVEGLAGGIVGIEIGIESIEGKWKMSQNRPEADRRGVVAGLVAEYGRKERP